MRRMMGGLVYGGMIGLARVIGGLFLMRGCVDRICRLIGLLNLGRSLGLGLSLRRLIRILILFVFILIGLR